MNAPQAGPRLSRPEMNSLLEEARDARAHAYAPYSRFPVGAALLSGAGRVVRGSNVENASYGLTICAERVAVFRAVSEGIRDFLAIAVLGPEDDVPCVPCGSCRQVLFEFAPALQVITAGSSPNEPEAILLADLLPRAFSPDRLPHRPPTR